MEIAEEAVQFFQKQFMQERDSTDHSLLAHVPALINEEENATLGAIPNSEEVKNAVFKLNGDSAGGPVGFLENFINHVGTLLVQTADIVRTVRDFFAANSLPKSITHTNLVLIPKKSNVQSFSDMRPISLSSFVNKIFSSIIHDRLQDILPKIISSNQSGFVKGRSIIENVLLTQELISYISKRGKPSNVVIKLDMAKAYDRVSCFFLMKILRKMGFSNKVVDLIWRLITNNYYSVIINGQPHGFFHSTRGVKQGDPLFPALFILSAEVLTRALNLIMASL
uniref:Non-LTR retroelement reverse transcriptase n=1 Tax=Solanum tuberosum TaxID=4113 RepID=M1CSU0_SOLTU